VHDDLVRITSANCGSWSQTFNYTADTTNAFGNLNKNGSSQFQATYSYLTNRMTGIGGLTPSYDANGNVLNDFLHQYAWDAAGRPVTIDGVGITYDALGRMVEQNHSGAYTQVVYAPTGGKLALMSGTTLNKAFVPLAGGSTAVYNSSGLAYYRHSDWLGSSRLASTPSRGVYFDTAYAPFGEAYASTGTGDLSFTGMNQDTVANLYDFPAREYGIQGRWPSPDPAGLAAVDLTDPQTLNRYAYVRNSPLHMVDPLGLDACEYGGDCGGGGGGGCPDGMCGGPGDPGCCSGSSGPVQSVFGNSVYVLPPIALPGQPLPGTTPSTFPTGPGVDWTNILFGPPDPALLIFNNYCFNGSGLLVPCADRSAVAECEGNPDSKSTGCHEIVIITTGKPDPAFVQHLKDAFPERPACWSGVFLDSAAHALDLPALPFGADFGDLIKGSATASAVWHAVSTGIRFNRQSPIIRNIMSLGEAGSAAAALIPTTISVSKGLYDEIKSMRAGTCKPGS